MIFSSMVFLWLFLPLLLIIYFIANKHLKNVILLLFSFIFYAWGEPKYVLLLIISIVFNYIFGLILDKIQKKNIKKCFVIFTVLFNLGLLGYFKYFNFFASNINALFNNTVINITDIKLPIGISFYTFQIISYIIDVYKNNIKVQKNIFSLALYISFFPQLIAGPIIKYHDIEKQLTNRTITLEGFAKGIRRFIYGLSKKVLLSNHLAIVADTIFESNINMLSMPIAWLGIICYTLQIYYDFSGYSDMAIGLGKMFGFEFMENFNLPYISKSITEFWKRWHISLSTWFKEYLYIPLGGNRKGKLRTYINLAIVFLATGIWHGASWNFVVWGAYNGIFLIIERIKLKQVLDKNKFKIINHIYTMLIIIIGWVFFRSNSLTFAINYIQRMFQFNNLTNLFDLSYIINARNIFILIIAILFSGIAQALLGRIKQNKKIQEFYHNYLELLIICILFLICILSLASNTYNPFIYFRF